MVLFPSSQSKVKIFKPYNGVMNEVQASDVLKSNWLQTLTLSAVLLGEKISDTDRLCYFSAVYFKIMEACSLRKSLHAALYSGIRPLFNPLMHVVQLNCTPSKGGATI
jgi:hypothetical protein